MGTRIATAVVLLALVYAWLFMAPYPFFTMGALFIYMVGAYEMGPLLGFKSRIPFLTLATIVATLSFVIAPPGLYVEGQIPNYIVYFVSSAMLMWILLIPLLKSYPHNTKWHENKALNCLLAIFMLLPFLQGLLILRATGYSEGQNTGAFVVLAVMALVWCADSGAYFTGMAVGKTKLLEAVSPKKTREGLYGGIALALLGLVIFDYLGFYSIYGSDKLALMVAGFVAIIFSVIGDLVESMLKRIVGIKDSGKIFPGHGGMLDRIDSQLAAIPCFIATHMLITTFVN